MNITHQKIKKTNSLKLKHSKGKTLIETAFHDISDGPRLGPTYFQNILKFYFKTHIEHSIFATNIEMISFRTYNSGNES